MIYKVTIAEKSEKRLSVKANTPSEAVAKALDEYVRDYWDGTTEFDISAVIPVREGGV